MKLKIDWQHLLITAGALVALAGPSLLPAGSLALYAAKFGPWLAIASTLLALLKQSVVTPAPSTAPPTVPPLPLLCLLFAPFFLAITGVLTGPTGCTKAQEQILVTDMTPTGACVASEILGAGVTDPVAIGIACGGIALQGIWNIVQELLAVQLPGLDGGSALSAEATSRLLLVREKTRGLLGNKLLLEGGLR